MEKTIKTIYLVHVLILFLTIFTNAGIAQSNTKSAGLVTGWNSNLIIQGVYCDIYIPQNYKNRNLLLLPGWNFSRRSWTDKTILLTFADKFGYALIAPEMKTTLYESEYFTQTKLKWNTIPGGKFIRENLIPILQKQYNILLPDQKNFMLGLSTGGRGVALIALENPGIFTAGASLSGDFSQEKVPGDRLMIMVYGEYKLFPERWKGRDNPMARAREWTMPLFLSHGMEDKIVPPSQTKLFYNELVKHHGDKIKIIYREVPGQKHDYAYWGSELNRVFDFFNDL